MATETRNDKLLEFYSECQRNGYTDMKDKTQSLKAKVIASDLGLNYSKIGALYDEAKKVSEKKIQLDSKEGKLVYSCYSSSYNYEKESPILELYTYDSNSYYCVADGKRISGAPSIFTETVVLPKIYTRAPSTTYYGVAYNGMATGTVSHDPGGETMRMEKTGGANIVFKIGEDKYPVKAVKPSQQIYSAFKRDESFRLFYNGTALILDNMNQVTYSGDIYDSMRQIALPDSEAQKAVDLLRRMGSNQLPPSDQALYEKAVTLLSSKSSGDIQRAIDTFDLISDFKDAPQQKEKAEKRLAEVVQAEKEAAIIAKERRKKVTIISTILAIIALIVGTYFIVNTTHAKAIENLPYVKDNLYWSYQYFETAGVRVGVQMKKDGTLRYYKSVYNKYKKNGAYEDVEDTTYRYTIEVSGISTYIIKAGSHTFKIGGGLTHYYGSREGVLTYAWLKEGDYKLERKAM